MSRYLKFIGLSVLILFSCCGCNGDITRDLRHAGFSVSGSSFVCTPLVPSKDKEKDYEKIKYLSNVFAITDKGKIYELSLGQQYLNEQNCKKSTFDLSIVSVFDNLVARASDNKYYYLTTQNNIPAYSEVTALDNSYSIYNLLLSDPEVLKVQTIDQSQGYYYVLKSDGNIYNYVIARESYNLPYSIVSVAIVYNKNDYNSKIIDFYEAFNSPSTFVRTKKEIYRMQATNQDECMRYADVSCKYNMALDEVLTEYQDRILSYNGSFLITDYGRVFNVGV